MSPKNNTELILGSCAIQIYHYKLEYQSIVQTS